MLVCLEVFLSARLRWCSGEVGIGIGGESVLVYLGAATLGFFAQSRVTAHSMRLHVYIHVRLQVSHHVLIIQS